MADELRSLFTPTRIGRLTLKNRIYSSGHAEAMAESGRPTERLRRYHEAKARGGCALTIFGGSSSVHPSSPAAAWKQIANHDDSIVPAYRALADAVHEHGCLVFTQLTHLGRRAQSDPEAGHVLLAPSQIPERVHREVPHELEPEQIAERLARSGLVDFLSIIGGGAHTYSLQAAAVPNMSFSPGVYVPLAARIKAAVPGMPILHASRIVDPLHADRLVAAGDVDVVGMTRALIADPDLPRKAHEGRLDDIRTCVGANEGCIDRIYQGKPVTCVQNPTTGREGELADVRPVAAAKKVVVVGGGVAGLEAARMATLRGCRVVLLEKAAELGGQVLVAARAPARAEYAGIVRFLAAQVRKLGVDVRLGVEATAPLVLAERPDAVIVATGSHAYIPPVPGSDGKHVVTDRDVLTGEAKVGANVVLVDDVHTEEALSTAELLLDQGKRVEVISPLFYVGQDVGVTSIAPLYGRLYTKGVVLTPSTELRAVEGSTVVVANVYSGAVRRIEAVDTVVLAAGSRSTDALYRALKGHVAELHAAGDCVAPRGVHQAILDGTRAARAI